MYGSLSGAIAALFVFAVFQVAGLFLSAALLPRESPGTQALAGSMAGSVMMQWFPALAAFAFGFDLRAQLGGILLAALAAVGSSWLLGKQGRAGALLSLPGQGAKAFFRHKSLIGVGALWLFFCFLVLHSFRWEDGRVFSSQATYGDMAMHLSFITSLARQGTFPPSYSLLPGTRLSYPFLSDSISSTLYLVGAPLRLAYCLPMLAAGAQVFFGGWLLLRALMGGRRRFGLAWMLFFFNGGLGLLYFFGRERGFAQIFTGFYQTPTNLIEENIRWVNVVVDMLLPQRATLFGWAILFPTLYLLYRGVFQGRREYFPMAGVLAGAMPMVHTHSFLALALVCGAWLTAALCQARGIQGTGVRAGKILVAAGLLVMAVGKEALAKRGMEDSPWLLVFACGAMGLWAAFLLAMAAKEIQEKKGKELAATWGLLLGITCLLAVPQLFTWTFRQVSGGSMVRGHFAWVTGPDNYLWFYLKNLGLAALLALAGLLAANGDRFARYCPAVAIWFLGEFVEFQPNDYDNNKLFYVAWIFLSCAAADGLCLALCLVKERKAQIAGAGLAMGLFALPAVFTMGRETVASYELFGEGALWLCQCLEESAEPEAVVLTDQRHNNEVASLAGRNVVCGSPSYLFYHGLNYSGSEAAAREMYQDPKGNTALFEEYGVDYILVSDFERSSFQVDEGGLEELFGLPMYDDGSRKLYKTGLGQ